MSSDIIVGDPHDDLEIGEEPATDAEVKQLRAQVEDLQQQVSAPSAHRGRRWAVSLLIALGCVLAFLANPAVWVRNVLLDTDDWTAMVAPLTRNEVVAGTLSVVVVDNLFEALDAQQEIQQVLPEKLGFLSTPLSLVLHDLATDTVSKVILSDAFNSAWVGINRLAHRSMVAVLRFEGTIVDLDRGELVVDLSDVLEAAQGLLGLENFELPIDPGPLSFVLFSNRQLAAVQSAVSVLDGLSPWLPVVALLIFAVAVWISLRRRRAVLWIGIGLAITMAVTLILLAVAQPIVLASIPSAVVRILTDEIWNIVVRGLVVQTVLILILGILVGAGAVLAGPRPWAVKLRSSVREQVASWR